MEQNCYSPSLNLLLNSMENLRPICRLVLLMKDDGFSALCALVQGCCMGFDGEPGLQNLAQCVFCLGCTCPLFLCSLSVCTGLHRCVPLYPILPTHQKQTSAAYVATQCLLSLLLQMSPAVNFCWCYHILCSLSVCTGLDASDPFERSCTGRSAVYACLAFLYCAGARGDCLLHAWRVK